MSWQWRCEDASGNQVNPEGVGDRFPTQSDAESWLGECWRDLYDRGVLAVSLLDGDRVVYGPMSLLPGN